MHCPNRITYVIQKGDNLYQLAKYYQTTVTDILALNPGIDPYNLQINSTVYICPAESFTARTNYGMLSNDANKKIDLYNAMRLAWSQHIYWTRMLLISIAERLMDADATTKRLLKNPDEIAAVFRPYYSENTAKAISQLLTEHLQIGGELITALRDGRTSQADRLNRQWYQNADKMADAFSSINPYFNHEELKNMLYKHLELTTNEVAFRLARNYPSDIDAFNKVESEAMMMADYFVSGIIKQFPQKF